MVAPEAALGTGFADLLMSTVIASVQAGIMPTFSFPWNYTDIDIMCDAILHLAFKPQRKHNMYLIYLANNHIVLFDHNTIYHILNKASDHWSTMWRWINEAGFDVKCIANLLNFFEILTPF